MASFSYKALSQDGKLSKGHLQAANPLDLESRLMRMGLELISFKLQSNQAIFMQRSITQQDIAVFCYQLEQLHSAGVPILESLHDLRDSCQHGHFKKILFAICAEVEGGKTLSQALAVHSTIFNSVFINLIAAGEQTGKLPLVLQHLHQTISWQIGLRSQSKRLLAYPAFLAFIMLFTITFLMAYLIPQMVSFLTAAGHELPLNTRILIAISTFFADYWWLMLAITAVTVTLLIAAWHQFDAFKLKLDGMLLKLPFSGGILKKIIIARYTRYFALTYEAGIPILQALKISESVVGNRAISEELQSVQQQINAGCSVYEGFSSLTLFPPLVLRMIKVGENTGNLEKTLHHISQFYDHEVRTEIAQLLSILEPLLTVVMGAVLAFIMLSVLGPVYSTFESLRL